MQLADGFQLFSRFVSSHRLSAMNHVMDFQIGLSNPTIIMASL